MISLVTFATCIDSNSFFLRTFWGIDVNQYIPSEVRPALKALNHFSMIKSAKTLLKHEPGRNYAADLMKIGVILAGILGHTALCLETAFGILSARRINALWSFFSHLHSQPVTNMGSFDMFDITSGLVIFFTSYELIQGNRFSPSRSFINRYLRYIPTIVTLLSIEFCWPIFTDGPLVGMVVKQISYGTCADNWWKPMLLLTNTQSMDACVSC